METEESLQGKLITIQRLMLHARDYLAAHAGPLGDPRKGQGRILALLKLRDGISTKELAQALGMRVSSLNEQLAKMERAGVIERRFSEADKRVQLIYLTETGKAEEQIQMENPVLFSGFTDEELEQLGRYLDHIIDNLESELPADARESFFHKSSMRAAALARMLGEDNADQERVHPFPGMSGMPDMRELHDMRGFHPFMSAEPFSHERFEDRRMQRDSWRDHEHTDEQNATESKVAEDNTSSEECEA